MGTRPPDTTTVGTRTLIHSIPETHDNEYRLWAELIPCQNPAGHMELRFSSEWTGAKDPTALQTRARFMLSPAALDNLQQLIGSR